MDDIQDISNNIQAALSEFASGPINEVRDLSKQVRDNFIDANSAANLEITGEDKLVKMSAQLVGLKKGYEKLNGTILSLNTNLNGINDTTELGLTLLDMQSDMSDKIERAKQEETKVTNDIANSQSSILQLEQLRSTTPIGTDEYKEYTELIKDANAQLAFQETNLSGLQAQQAGFKSISDGFLENLLKEVNSGKDINEITAIRRQLYADNVNLSGVQIELLDRQLGQLNQMGPGLDDYIKQWGASNDAVMRSFDSIAEGMTSTVEKIPLVGNLLKSQMEGPLKEAAEESKKAWQGFTEGMQASMASGDNFATAFKKNFSQIGGAIGGMGKAIMSALFNPFTLVLVAVGTLVFLLKSAFDELSRLETASMDFRKELGMSANQVAIIRDQVEGLEKQYSTIGLRVDDFFKVATALSDVNASVDHATSQQIEFVGILEKATGVSADVTAGAMANIMKLGGTAKGEAEGLVMQIQSLAEKHGVKFAQVMEDVSNAGEDALIFARGSAKALAEGAVHARRMGSSLEDVAASAESLLDFESSINSQMQASTMFGRHINLNGLRAAALAGDTNAMLEQRMHIMDSLGGLENMSRWQQKSLAEAMGTTVSELMNMNKAREQERMLQKAAAMGNKEAQAALDARQKSLADENKTELEKLLIMEKQNRQAESMRAMNETIQGLFLEIKQALLPIAEKIMPAIVDYIDEFVGAMKKADVSAEEVKGKVNGILDFVVTLGKAIMLVAENWKVLLGGIIAYKLIAFTISKISFPTPPTAPAGPGSSSIIGMNPTAMLQGAAAILVLSASLFVAAKAFQEFGQVTWDAVGKGIIVMGAMTSALVVMSKMLDNNMTTVLKGVGILALLGLAIIPAAFAFQMFADVGWADVFTGLGALAAFGVLAGVLGAGPIPAFVAVGAGVIALLGLALIPFAYAAKLAAPAFETIANSFVNVAKSLSTLTLGEIGKLALLGASFALVGFMTPFVIGGAFAFGIMALALLAVGKALEIASPGLTALGEFLNTSAEAFNTMTDGLVNLAETESGLFGAAAGIAAVGAAMVALGVGSGVGAVVGGLGNAFAEVVTLGNADTRSPFEKLLAFADKADSLVLVADKMDLLLNSFDRLVGISDQLTIASVGIGNLGESLVAFANARNELNEDGSFLSFLGVKDESKPFDNLLTTLEHLAILSSRLVSLPLVASGLNSLFSAISRNAMRINANSVKNLSLLGEGLSSMMNSLGDVNMEKLLKLPTISSNVGALSTISLQLSQINMTEQTLESVNLLGTALKKLANCLAEEDFEKLLKLEKLSGLGDTIGILKQFSGINFDNVATSFKTLSDSMLLLANSVKTLDIDKLKQIKNELPNLDGAEGPIGPRGLGGTPGATPIMFTPNILDDSDNPINTGTPTPGQFRVIRASFNPNQDAMQETTNQRREQYFRRIYESPEEIINEISSRLDFIEDEKAKYINDPVGLNNIQGGIKLVMQDIALLEKIKSDMLPTEPTPSLSDIFGTPPPVEQTNPTPSLSDVFATPPVEQVNPTPSLSDVFANPPTEIVNETTAITPNEVTNPINTSVSLSEKIMTIFNSLNSFTSESFIGGMNRATNAIRTFANALDGFSDENVRIMDKLSGFFSSTEEGGVETSPTTAIPTEQLDVSSEPIINLNIPETQPTDTQLNSNAEVVRKLNELITLMKNGGISVNMDGRKVSKVIATRED